MCTLKLTDYAQIDLEQIADYSFSNWGEKQANFYLEQLEKAFYNLLDNPHLGESRDNIKTGYRSLAVEKHIIFYRLNDNQLEIMRILHYRMDVISHL
jgi:toxin ParE1/3/4